jgi:hypothetical protein
VINQILSPFTITQLTMKPSLLLTILTLTILIGLASCTKDEEIAPVENPQESPTFSIQLKIAVTAESGLEGLPPVDNLKALFNITHEDGSSYKDDSLVTLSLKDGYLVSQPINSSKGNFKVGKLWLIADNGDVVYAAPEPASPKAVESNISVPFSFAINQQNQITEVSLQVLAIHESDLPYEFGFDDDQAFGDRPYHLVTVQTNVQVGSIPYNDLDLQIDASAHNDQLTPWQKSFEIVDGRGTVKLPKKYNNHTLAFEIWGQRVEKVITDEEVEGMEEILMETNHILKRIKRTENFIMEPQLKLQNITEFFYDQSDRLSKATYYHRVPATGEMEISMHDEFTYSAENRVATVARSNPDGEYLYSRQDYYYDGQGRILKIDEPESAGPKTAIFNYNEQSKSLESIHYQFYAGQSIWFPFRIIGGNLITNMASSGDGVYDKNINPFAHQGYTDIFLRNISKNNVLNHEPQNASNGFPTLVKDKSEYVYDADGYPTEIITTFNSYTSGEFAFREKKVIEYY